VLNSALKFLLFFITLIVFFFPGKIFGQSNDLFIQAQTSYGLLAIHTPKVRHLVTNHFFLYEAAVIKKTSGRKSWERSFNNPEIGIAYFNCRYGGNQTLGTMHAVFPFVNFQLFKLYKVKTSFRLGTGLSYSTKIFHPTDNYKNVAIGSRLNADVNLLLQIEFPLTEKLAINSGVGLNHISNSAFKMPNLGLNTIYASAALKYKLKTLESKPMDTLINKNKRYNFHIVLAAAAKEIYPVGGNKYFASTFSFNFLCNSKNQKFIFGPGIDVFYDSSIRAKQKRIGEPFNFSYLQRFGLNGLFGLSLGHLQVIPLQMGVYLFPKYKEDGIFYNRFSLRYVTSKGLLFHIALKSHFANADYLETGIGFNL